MYYGNVTQWIKFANSLKLHMGILLSDVNPSLAQSTAEAAAPYVFTSNDDNARIIYLSSQPNTNPVYDNLVASGRHDFVAANTLVDTMNNWSDPRRALYFTMVDTSSEQGVIKLAYVGGENGMSNDYTQYSHVSDKIQQPTFEGMIFDYAQTEFLLAQGAARGFNVGGTAEEHYNKGIQASILYWGGTQEDVDTYLANPLVAYSTAAGDFKQKIGLQYGSHFTTVVLKRGPSSAYWISLRLSHLPDAVSDYPVRYTYPIAEQTLNGANYEAASAAIGGDLVTTKLFWDKY